MAMTPDTDACLGHSYASTRVNAQQKNINMKDLSTLQLIEHLSSRGAPDSVLETIAEELLTGRTWINLLVGL
jgi:hypothetical protein